MLKEKNFIVNLYPLTKLLMSGVIAMISIIYPSYQYAFICFAISTLIACYTGILKDYIKVVLAALGVLMIFIMVIQIFTYSTGEVLLHWRFFTLTKEGLVSGLNIASKVLAVGASLILFFKITTIKDLISALENKNVSPVVAYVVLATLQMIPEMLKQSKIIMDAQKTRGVETEGKLSVRIKAFLPSISPLVLSSIAATEEKAITLESRAFSAPVKKTHLYSVVKNHKDKVADWILYSIFILLILGRVLLWK